MKAILCVIPLTLLVSGCLWKDDFRDRIQPQYLELPPEPTLNPDSPEYVGVHRKTYAERQAEAAEEACREREEAIAQAQGKNHVKKRAPHKARKQNVTKKSKTTASQQPLPAIDNLSKIPPLPDHPG